MSWPNKGMPMRWIVMCIVAVSAWVVLLPGSSPAAEKPAGTEKITKEAQETIDATKAYTAQQKEAFQRKAHEELAALQKQIIALRGKLEDASAATRAELQKSIAEVEKKKDAAKNKLDELRSATDETWSGVKSGVSSALDELTQSFQRVRDKLP